MSDTGYWATIAWGPRGETPERLAARLIEAIESMRVIDPVFSQWYTVLHEETFYALELQVAPAAERIALGVVKDDDDMADPAAGYFLRAYNFDQPGWTPNGFRIEVSAGSTINWSGNSVSFVTSLGCDPNPSLVTFALFKRALLILAETFDASFGYTSSNGLAEVRRRDRDTPRLGPEWMTYLGPCFARLANPPPSAIVERLANGGLFMAATNEVFSTEDTEHIAVARDIQAAVALFNALKEPYPGLELPEADEAP